MSAKTKIIYTRKELVEHIFSCINKNEYLIVGNKVYSSIKEEMESIEPSKILKFFSVKPKLVWKHKYCFDLEFDNINFDIYCSFNNEYTVDKIKDLFEIYKLPEIVTFNFRKGIETKLVSSEEIFYVASKYNESVYS